MVNFAFLDSGVGGLPYLKYLKSLSPSSSCVYVGDTEHFPYGEKNKQEIIEYSSNCINRIIHRFNPHVIVIACNTISVTALEDLRREFSLPIVGTVPAIKPAGLNTLSHKIGLLATNATVNHPYTQKLIQDFASSCEVYSKGDPDFVSFIEKDYFHSSRERRLKECLTSIKPFMDKGCDEIVLACTHFLNVVDELKEVCGSKITIVDSRDGVVRHALEVEKKLNLPPCKDSNESSLYITQEGNSSQTEMYKNFCTLNHISYNGLLD